MEACNIKGNHHPQWCRQQKKRCQHIFFRGKKRLKPPIFGSLHLSQSDSCWNIGSAIVEVQLYICPIWRYFSNFSKLISKILEEFYQNALPLNITLLKALLTLSSRRVQWKRISLDDRRVKNSLSILVFFAHNTEALSESHAQGHCIYTRLAMAIFWCTS
jgi:hypothetical protein